MLIKHIPENKKMVEHYIINNKVICRNELDTIGLTLDVEESNNKGNFYLYRNNSNVPKVITDLFSFILGCNYVLYKYVIN